MPVIQIMGLCRSSTTAQMMVAEERVKEYAIMVPDMKITAEMVSPFVVAQGSGKELVAFTNMYSHNNRSPEVKLAFAQQIAQGLISYADEYQQECRFIEVRIHSHLASDDDVWVRFERIGIRGMEFDKGWKENVDARRPESIQPPQGKWVNNSPQRSFRTCHLGPLPTEGPQTGSY